MLGPFTKTNDLEALQMVLSKLSYRVGDLPLLCTGNLTLCEGMGRKKKELTRSFETNFFFFLNSLSPGRKEYSENFILQSHKSETLSLSVLCLLSNLSCALEPLDQNSVTGLFIHDQSLLKFLLSLWGFVPPHNALFFFKFYYSFRRVPHSNSSSSPFISL